MDEWRINASTAVGMFPTQFETIEKSRSPEHARESLWVGIPTGGAGESGMDIFVIVDRRSIVAPCSSISDDDHMDIVLNYDRFSTGIEVAGGSHDHCSNYGRKP
jgi:hypothetical protein